VNRKILRASLTVGMAVVATTALLVGGSAQAVPSVSSLPKLTLTLSPTSITVGGTPQSGAVEVVSTATGTKEASAVLFQLKPGVSLSEFDAFLKSPAEKQLDAAAKYGSIAFDAEVNPGQTSEAQTTLVAGQYVALIAEGEGAPKVQSAFTVASSSSPATVPTPEATIRSIEFGFRGPSTLRDGELVRFENEGFLVHMDIAFPVKSMKAAKQAVKLLLANKEKQLEKLFAGAPVSFNGPLSSGAYQQEIVTAKPGIYVQACFMDTQDGRSHTQLGMERIIRITK
jgi:hypothetical protein